MFVNGIQRKSVETSDFSCYGVHIIGLKGVPEVFEIIMAGVTRQQKQSRTIDSRFSLVSQIIYGISSRLAG